MTITKADIDALKWIIAGGFLFIAAGVVSVLAYWSDEAGHKIVSAALYFTNAGFGWAAVECVRRVWR